MKSKRLVFLLGFLQLVVILTAQDEVKRTHLGFSVTPQFSLQPMRASEVKKDKYSFCFSLGGDVFYADVDLIAQRLFL